MEGSLKKATDHDTQDLPSSLCVLLVSALHCILAPACKMIGGQIGHQLN